MIRFRVVALSVTAAAFGTVALLGRAEPKSTAGRMQLAAGRFLASLSPQLRAKATFDFTDPHRTRWFFTPQQDEQKRYTRKGVRLEEMTAEQKAAALELLRSGLSATGFETALGIISLEALLKELEGDRGQMVRNTGWYFVSVFGEPTPTGRWGWRFEGHHLSVNYTLDKGEVIASSPILFGVNPAEVKAGEKKGLRLVAGIEDRARDLIASLSPEQMKLAKQPHHFPEIKEGQANADVGQPVGITADRLTAEQRTMLAKLLAAYTDRMPEDLAAVEARRAADTPPDKLYFAYSGSPQPGQPYTYRVYAPSFVVEFLNVQADSAKNPANHIHSVWRRLPADFGLAE
jgi:hypothetical protein